MFIYKIRNGEGKFSTGGARPHFTHLGKHWNLSGLRLHLKECTRRENPHYPWPYDECEIVKYKLVETETIECIRTLWKN